MGLAAAVSSGLEGTPLHVLVLGAALAAAAALVALRVASNTFTGAAPPADEGVPFVGGLLRFLAGPWPLMASMYAKHGEVFTVPLLHRRMTFLLGPHASPHFFNATDEKMSQTEVYDFNVPTFGPGVVYDVDLRTRGEQFRMLAEALRTAKLRSYVPHFVAEAQAYFAKWGDAGVVDLNEAFSELIILTASRTLLGREVREQMFKEVAGLYHDLDAGMRPISVLFPYAPLPFHRRRDAARRALAELFGRVIRARRAGAGAGEDDMLQTLVDARYKSVHGGRALSDGEVTGMLIAALFAGQHTSSITSTWTGLHLIADEAARAAALAEQDAVVAERGEGLDMEALAAMPHLHRCIQEALRLHPPLIMLMRYAKEPFSVTTSAGRTYTVPKGHVVATSPTFSHRLPHVFTDPDAFQPDRFAAPREEDKAVPFSYIGFGGGRHGCMGQQFAFLQVKTIWSLLLRSFDFELLDPFPEPDYSGMVIGPKPCRVRYTRRAAAPRGAAAGAGGEAAAA